jgi:N-acetyl-alpha-D-muramate 1-phosphate uridylyltransferase
MAGTEITTAMVFAAGLGTRMKPLTDHMPKALVEVGGRALVDHMLDRLAQAGITHAVVNAYHFAPRLVEHLEARVDRAPKLTIVREDGLAEPLETEGGLINALSHLGDGPILTCNADAIWLDDMALPRLMAAYDPDRMNGLLLLADLSLATGFDGPGDFFWNQDGTLTRRGDAPSAPYAYAGVQVTDVKHFTSKPPGKRSLAKTWFEDWGPAGRLHGLCLDGAWLHVGDPDARDVAEQRLLERETPDMIDR